MGAEQTLLFSVFQIFGYFVLRIAAFFINTMSSPALAKHTSGFSYHTRMRANPKFNVKQSTDSIVISIASRGCLFCAGTAVLVTLLVPELSPIPVPAFSK